MQTPLPTVDAVGEDALDALRSVRFQLASHGYSEDGLRARLGVPGSFNQTLYLDRLDPAHIVFPEDGGGTLDRLIQLFLLGYRVQRSRVEDALAPETWSALEAVRLIVREDTALRATAAWVPVFGVTVLCDFRSRRAERDFVFFPDQSSAVVAHYLDGGTPSGELALDVGTGSGLSAFVLARNGRHRRVLGQDMNPRAIAFAKVGAVLNDLPVEFEVVAADALSRREPGTVDLMSFVLPHLYTSHNTEAVSVHADGGDRLLDEVYGALDRVLSPTGEAVLFHQARTPPATQLPRRLEGVTGRERLRIEHTSLPNKFVNAEFGLSHVRRRGPGEPDFLHFESDTLQIDRAAADLRRETATLLATGDWLSAVVALKPGLLVHDSHMEHHGRLVRCGRLIGHGTVEPDLGDALFRIDGSKTAAEVLGEGHSDAARQALERCIRRGELTLRRSPAA